MKENIQDSGFLAGFSALGSVILAIIYILQTQFQSSFILAPGTTLLLALIAAVGALLLSYGRNEDL